jgi:hypothetical protein
MTPLEVFFMPALRYAMILSSLVPSLAWAVTPVGGAAKLDNFGYRPGDPKMAYFVADPGAVVEVRRSEDDSLALALGPASILDRGQEAPGPHPIHGDHVWRVDFSALSATGRYYLEAPSLAQRSYDFSVDAQVYAAALTAVAKTYFYQRCGGPKAAAHGGPWSDGACHLSDQALQPLCGSGADYGAMAYGPLDLSGGWHDAGDYEKKLGRSDDCGQNAYGDGGQSLWFLLNAYERAPWAFGDGSLDIPESGNGVPDLLDQARWELDWYLKMQRPDGHVLAKVVVLNLGGFSSPPSADTNPRFYGPPSREAEAIFTACVAQAARIFAAVPGQSAYAATLRAAALKTWQAWVLAAPPGDYKLWAAAEVYRLDPSRTEARDAVDGDRAWSGTVWVNPANVALFGIVTYLQSPGATPTAVAGMRRSLGQLVDYIFNEDDAYDSGMPWWLYSWNSNWFKADVAQDLLWAADLGATGAHSAQACREHALQMLHYLHGANPLNMCYLSHADALGAKHGAWRIFNVWFGYYDDATSRARYIGKPAALDDPLYPYVSGADNFGIRDDDSSLYGPPPGYVPPGPTYMYVSLGGKALPPLAPDGQGLPYAKAYRDWDYGGPGGLQTQPWIVNEPGIYDQAAYLGLAAWFSVPRSAGPGPTPGPTTEPRGESGAPEILDARAWPDPNPRYLAVRLEGRAQGLELKLFSPSAAVVVGRNFDGAGPGWSHLDLSAMTASLGNGAYFFKVRAEPGSASFGGRFFRLR